MIATRERCRFLPQSPNSEKRGEKYHSREKKGGWKGMDEALVPLHGLQEPVGQVTVQKASNGVKKSLRGGKRSEREKTQRISEHQCDKKP